MIDKIFLTGAANPPGGNDKEETKKKFHGVRVDQIYVFKLRENFIYSEQAKRVTRATGTVEDQATRTKVSIQKYNILSSNEYLGYRRVWTNNDAKKFEPLLPLEFKVRAINIAIVPATNRVLRPEGFSLESRKGYNIWNALELLFNVPRT